MGTSSRLVAMLAVLAAASAAAAAQPLEPEWSRPVGGRARLVGVEEYGRCSVFVDNGAVQVVAPSGAVTWSWRFSAISKYINPREVAVTHACDAIAFVGDASYKYVWIVDRGGQSSSIKFTATPADVEFDRTGKLVAVGTYAGSMYLYSINGELQWRRDTGTAIVQDLAFTDDNGRILMRGWAGVGVVSVAGHVEWGMLASRLRASRDLDTLIIGDEPRHGPGGPSISATDGHRKTLWQRGAPVEAFLSSTGHRILILDGVPQVVSRAGDVIARFADYTWPVALSEDGSRMWLRAVDHLACVDDRGNVLATIGGEFTYRAASVSRDFGQVLVMREKDLTPIAVERYEVPKPCRP